MYDIKKLKELAVEFNVQVDLYGEQEDKLTMSGKNGDINKFWEAAKEKGLVQKDPLDESLNEKYDFEALFNKIQAQEEHDTEKEIKEGVVGDVVGILLFDTTFANQLYDEFYRPLTDLIEAGKKEEALAEYQEIKDSMEKLRGKKFYKVFVEVQDERLEKYKAQIDAIEDARVKELALVESRTLNEDATDESYKPHTEKVLEYLDTNFPMQYTLEYVGKFGDTIARDYFPSYEKAKEFAIELLNQYNAEGDSNVYALIITDQNDNELFNQDVEHSYINDDYDEYDDYEESYTPISEDVDDEFENTHHKAENVEFVMTEYIPDSSGIEAVTKVNDTTYKVIYDGVEVEVVFDYGWDEWVYTINDKGPFAHSSYEWLVSDIRNVIDQEFIRESYFNDEPSWLDDEDPVDADREHANVYGGDRTYCDCGRKLERDEWGSYCPICDQEERDLDDLYHDASEDELRAMDAFDNLNESGFDTQSNIDLDMVGIRVANLLDPEALGDQWLEFDCNDPVRIMGSKDIHMSFEVISDDMEKRGYMRAHTDGTISVYIRNGSEGTFRNPQEIARFIAGEFGISL